jgi:DNA adenine methylase
MNTEIQTPLKWAGGKRWLVAKLRELYEPHRDKTFVDLFCGAGSVSLGLLPEKVLMNDLNQSLINFWQCIRVGSTITEELENTEEYFYNCHNRFNSIDPKSEVAAQLFYYLNRTCFNGLCRFNKKGKFNVPYGKYKKVNYRKNFDDLTPIIQDWYISELHFSELPIEANDFIYADPPYDCEFRNYSAAGFSLNDQVKLATMLANHNGPVVASNSATDMIVNLYSGLGFDIEYIDAPRRISCNGDRSKAKEILATKNL